VNRNEPSKVICVRMVRETDPYAVPRTSLGRHNHLAAGYANKSLRTLLKGPERGISQAERADSFRDARRSSFRRRTNSAMEPYRGSVESRRLQQEHARQGPVHPQGPQLLQDLSSGCLRLTPELAHCWTQEPLIRRPGDLSSVGCPAGSQRWAMPAVLARQTE
jgi:hypothetical protein